jgi:RNA-directed DNA polymerase
LRREGPNGEESTTSVSLESERHQMSGQPEPTTAGRGEAPRGSRGGEARSAAHEDARSGNGDEKLLELVVERSNVEAAIRRVKKNKGSPGIDGMTVEELPAFVAEHWPRVREEILTGRYQPKPVRRHTIPKKDGGNRELGIPTVIDRLIQQCILHVLQPRLDPTFSQHSHGFRPGRSAHDAVRAAQRFIQEGRRWVVDVDLEAFFDRVNHDVLMGRLAKRIADRRLLGLIRRYLDAGIMAKGLVVERYEGTPQGGPLSPLLANVLLDEVDKELEKRGHAFARYADDCNVYVRSKRAGERVMEGLRRLFAGLRLRVNETKSAVARPWDRKFLGYSFWVAKGREIKRRVAAKALVTMKDRIRDITKRSGGRSITEVVKELRGFLVGWKNYFQLADTPRVFDDLDEWIRHRLRAVQLKQWKRGTTIYRELVRRGMRAEGARRVARNGRSWWRNSGMMIGIALPNSYFDGLGLPRLADLNSSNRRMRTRTSGGVGGN